VVVRASCRRSIAFIWPPAQENVCRSSRDKGWCLQPNRAPERSSTKPVWPKDNQYRSAGRLAFALTKKLSFTMPNASFNQPRYAAKEEVLLAMPRPKASEMRQHRRSKTGLPATSWEPSSPPMRASRQGSIAPRFSPRLR